MLNVVDVPTMHGFFRQKPAPEQRSGGVIANAGYLSLEVRWFYNDCAP